MNELTEQLLPAIRQTILEAMKNHGDYLWEPDEYWWFGLLYSWLPPESPRLDGPIKENALYWALIDLEVPSECIVKRGAITCVGLDNISFIYRTRLIKGGIGSIEITPHMNEMWQFDHWFERPRGSAYDLAQRMINLDRWIPEIKDAAEQARFDGLRERMIREIQLQVAKAKRVP